MSEEIIRYVDAAREGDTSALGVLYTRTLKASFYLAGKLSSNDEAAVEIVKKAYARAFCTIGKLKKPEAFEIWMKQNIASAYIEGANFSYADIQGGAAESSMEFLSESVINNKEKADAVLNAVSDLEPEPRTAIVLHYYCGMPVGSLAKFLKVSESTVNALLENGKASIIAATGSETPGESFPGVLPVLTRLFQKEAEAKNIEQGAVREVFIYSLGIFNSFNEAEKLKKGPSIPGSSQSAASSNGYFSDNSSETLDIPQKPTDENRIMPTAEEAGIDFDDFAETAPRKSTSSGKKSQVLDILAKFGLDKLNVKTVIIGVVLVLVVIIAICGIVGAVKNKGDKPSSGNSQVVSEYDATDAKFITGGFEECLSIEYLDEDFCMFKSASTGKYGLLSYGGEVVMDPIYDGFERCTYGRDYSDRDSYHSLVVVGNLSYDISFLNGKYVPGEVHVNHETVADSLDSKLYDERDCYVNNYAAARKDGKWGYVYLDKEKNKEKKVIKFEYDAVNITDESSSNAAFCNYCRTVCFCTVNGEEYGYIPVKKDGKMGIINLENEIVAEFEYENILPGENGIFIAKKDGEWGVILVGDAIADNPAGVQVVVSANADIGIVDETDVTKYEVIVDYANVRSSMDATQGEANLVKVLNEGDIVEVYKLETAENGKQWAVIKVDDAYAYVSMMNLTKYSE